MKKLSFILPVYNVAAYVEKCIRSIRDKEMPFNEYEIIVINDGSPDNSAEIVKELQKEIPNIILINQNNAGVSAARNKGIEKATGEYIIFIDPDDYVNPNLLKKLYNRAKRDDLDILQSGRSKLTPDGKIIHMLGYKAMENKIFEGVSAYYEKDKVYQISDSSIGYLYKRALILKNNILFPVGVVHLEDGVFVRQVFTLSDKVGFLNCDFYQVYLRPGSASRSTIGISVKAAEGDIRSAKNLLDFKKKHPLKTEQKGLINTSIIKYTLLPLMRAVSSKKIDKFALFNQMVTNEGLRPLEIECVPKNAYLKYAKAYNKSVWAFGFVYLTDLLKKKMTIN